MAESDSALMTCFVERLSKGKHIQFVDGNKGGYAMAAKRLKEQILTKVQNPALNSEN
ncbi:MAG: DUF3095 family protein [Bdellovibrionia bacterium]